MNKLWFYLLLSSFLASCTSRNNIELNILYWNTSNILDVDTSNCFYTQSPYVLKLSNFTPDTIVVPLSQTVDCKNLYDAAIVYSYDKQGDTCYLENAEIRDNIFHADTVLPYEYRYYKFEYDLIWHTSHYIKQLVYKYEILGKAEQKDLSLVITRGSENVEQINVEIKKGVDKFILTN